MKVDAFGKLIRVEQDDLDENGRFVCGPDIVSVGANAFYPVKFFLKAVCMKNVETICQYAFLDCVELEYVYFSDNLTCIDYGAFMGCYKLEEVVFPESLKFLKHWAFLDCSGIKKVEFFSKLERIDKESQFQACDFLANEVFERCKYIEKFIFHQNFAYHQGLKKFSHLKEIQIDDVVVANKFWRDALYDSPQSLMLLDSKLFFNQDFVKNCLTYMALSFEKQFGSNEKLAETLVKGVFEQKLLLEEEKCFGKEPAVKKDDF